MKIISHFFNGTFFLILLLFLLDCFTPFDIKNQVIKTVTYFGIIILTLVNLIFKLCTLKSRKKVDFILPVLALIGVLIIGPLRIAFSSDSWKTQTILYENRHLKFKRVEFQMKNIGAFGYNKRTVEVLYITNLFMLISPFNKEIKQDDEWVKVNKELNELELKY